jgi:hypothetical protein
VAASDVDLTVARVRLGRRIGGAIPAVGADGSIALRGFRHPVLLLRHTGRKSSSSSSSSSRDVDDGDVGAAEAVSQAEAAARSSRALGVGVGRQERPGASGLSGRGGGEAARRAVVAAATSVATQAPVVGNDLSLNASVPGLVLTGPNAGSAKIPTATFFWLDDEATSPQKRGRKVDVIDCSYF